MSADRSTSLTGSPLAPQGTLDPTPRTVVHSLSHAKGPFQGAVLENATPRGVQQAEIVKAGRSRPISPAGHSWDAFFDGLEASDNFLRERVQPEAKARDRA